MLGLRLKGFVLVLGVLGILGGVAPPVQSMILRGYVSEGRLACVQQGLVRRHKALAQVKTDCLPESYLGRWQCLTVVTASGVAVAVAGQSVVSEIEFVRQEDGRITAAWQQAGWTETNSQVKRIDALSAIISRVSQYQGPGRNRGMICHCWDSFVQTDREHMAAESYVDQWVEGQYQGRYQTRSVLSRVSGSSSLSGDEESRQNCLD